jgi:dolichol kinase
MRVEIKRKFLHILLTSYPLFYAKSDNFTRLHIEITIGFIIVWCMSEWLRVNYKLVHAPTYILLKHMTRKKDDVLTSGFKTPNWLIGYLIPSMLFSQIHIINGVCVLCFGDTAASLFGKIGQRKSLQGSISGFIVSSIFCYIFTNSILLALGASFVGMLIEYMTLNIKDNYVVPLGGSIGSYMISLIKVQ